MPVHWDLPVESLTSAKYCANFHGCNSKQNRCVHIHGGTIPLSDRGCWSLWARRETVNKLARRWNEDNMCLALIWLWFYENSYWEMTESYYQSYTVYYLLCCTLNVYNLYRVHCSVLAQPISFSYLDEVHNRRTLGSYYRWNSSTWFQSSL